MLFFLSVDYPLTLISHDKVIEVDLSSRSANVVYSLTADVLEMVLADLEGLRQQCNEHFHFDSVTEKSLRYFRYAIIICRGYALRKLRDEHF